MVGNEWYIKIIKLWKITCHWYMYWLLLRTPCTFLLTFWCLNCYILAYFIGESCYFRWIENRYSYAYPSGHLVPPLLGTCLCSNCWDQFHQTCRIFSRLYILNAPRYFLNIALLPRDMDDVRSSEAKPRKHQGVPEVKSGAKTWQVQGIWSQQLDH